MNNTATLDAAGEAADAVSRLTDQQLHADGPGSVEDLVKFTRLIWLTVQDTWEQFQLRLDQGLEAGRVRHAAASASLACDGLHRVIVQLEKALVSSGGEVAGLPELIAALPEVRAIQKAARNLVDMLNAPAPPIDEARLAEGLAAVGRGDFEDTTAILERLKAGGEL